MLEGNFGQISQQSLRQVQSARQSQRPHNELSSSLKGCSFHGNAPRADKRRFISPWHARVELNGAEGVPGPQYDLGSTIGQRAVRYRATAA